ncbi:MAG: hypothetical protein AB7E60_09080 [Sphingobium sp.]
MSRHSLSLTFASAIALGFSAPVHAQAAEQATSEETRAQPPLNPATLGDALSCRSHDAAIAFAYALFLDGHKPGWMRKITDRDENVGKMPGLYGYRLRKPVSFFGQTVDRVYFLKDWVVTLWPRTRAEAFITQQKMERAPIRMTEQYYRFIDPEAGPMLGVFEPTDGTMASLFARALGAGTEAPPPSDVLFVGCNYAAATQGEFLEAANQADAMAAEAASDIGEMLRSRNEPPE